MLSMDTNAAFKSSIAQVRHLIRNSEPHFVYFYLNTYQSTLYHSWTKDPSNTELLGEYEKRRQALDEQLLQFYPSNIDECQVLRNVAQLCAKKVARELKVTLSYGKAEEPVNSKVLVSSVRVAIDSFQADIQMNPTNLCCEIKFNTLVIS